MDRVKNEKNIKILKYVSYLALEFGEISGVPPTLHCEPFF